MEQAGKLILYTYFRSSTCWRVRIVLNHKKIPHDFSYVHLFKGQQKSEDYKKVNPNAVLPNLYRPFPHSSSPTDKSSSSLWPSVSIWRRPIQNTPYCPKTPSNAHKSEASAR